MITTATQPLWLSVLDAVLLGVTAIASGVFAGRYIKRYRWWKTDIGRDLVAFSSCLAVFCTYGAAASVFPDIPGRVEARALVLVVIASTSVLRLLMFENFVGGKRKQLMPAHTPAEDKENEQ